MSLAANKRWTAAAALVSVLAGCAYGEQPAAPIATEQTPTHSPTVTQPRATVPVLQPAGTYYASIDDLTAQLHFLLTSTLNYQLQQVVADALLGTPREVLTVLSYFIDQQAGRPLAIYAGFSEQAYIERHGPMVRSLGFAYPTSSEAFIPLPADQPVLLMNKDTLFILPKFDHPQQVRSATLLGIGARMAHAMRLRSGDGRFWLDQRLDEHNLDRFPARSSVRDFDVEAAVCALAVIQQGVIANRFQSDTYEQAVQFYAARVFGDSPDQQAQQQQLGRAAQALSAGIVDTFVDSQLNQTFRPSATTAVSPTTLPTARATTTIFRTLASASVIR